MATDLFVDTSGLYALADRSDPLRVAAKRHTAARISSGSRLIVAAKGVKISEVFELPLVMTSVIRRLLAEEYRDMQGEDTLRKFNQALEQVDATGSRIACRFLDIFQEMLEKRIDGHNDYLAKMQREFGVDLSSFRFEREST